MITSQHKKQNTFNISFRNTNDETNMYKATDDTRDQSYFLFNTSREQLNYLRFPLGGLLKDETRDIAKKLGLNVADKPDSQDICFVPNGDYSSVIKKYKPEAYQKGNIKDINGKVVGVHDGIINFTIGQRRGIKVSDKEPLYVIEINAEKNEIIVGSKKYLAQKKIKLKDLNILCKTDELNEQILVKVRSTGKLLKANIDLNKDKASIELLEDEYGISPGQACVFYSKNKLGYKVLGGGWITN